MQNPANSVVCNPHSTTSPKASPNTNHSSSRPTPDVVRHLDQLDANDNLVSPHLQATTHSLAPLDDCFENDNISVTGSNSIVDDDDKHTTPSPPPLSNNSGGAFTALIQRNHAAIQPASSSTAAHHHQMHGDQHASSGIPLKKSAAASDILTGLAHNANSPSPPQQLSPPQHHAFNHALAAQLFLQQSPLIPQPSQWLYSQLYGNYNDMPWFRNSLPAAALSANFRSSSSSAAAAADEAAAEASSSSSLDKQHESRGDVAARRAIKLVTHHQQATAAATSSSSMPTADDDDADFSSPQPVSSSRRSPSPSRCDRDASTPTPGDHDDVEVMAVADGGGGSGGGAFGPIRRTLKMATDVWRPY